MLFSDLNRAFFFASLVNDYEPAEIKSMWNYLDETVSMDIEELIQRLKSKEPLQYILGYAWFYNRKIKVSPCTLIPRPETEELCNLVFSEIEEKSNLRCIDIGTGSGCIPITLALGLRNSIWTAIDVSECALEVTRYNCNTYAVLDRIHLEQCDFLNSLPMEKDCDVIVSNPPYIGRNEALTMEANVIQWEPEIALFPAHADVLIFYKRLAFYLEKQKKGCMLFAEINPRYSVEIKEIFRSIGFPKILYDMSGKERFLQIKKEGH